MRAAEFLERINSFSDLEEFLDDEQDNYLIDSDIRYYDGLDDAIDEDVRDYVQYDYDGWEELCSMLDNVSGMDNGEGYYRRNGSFDYDLLSDRDFEDIKDEIYDRYDRNGWFDEEDDEEEDEEDEEEDSSAVVQDPEDLTPLETEDVSFEELFTSGVDAVLKAREERIENQKKKEAEETASLESMLFSASFTF